MSQRRVELTILGGLGLLSLLAGILASGALSQRIPQIADEAGYLFQAQVFARGQLWAPDADLDTFDTPFVMPVNGHRVGTFAIGWPLVLALGELGGAGPGWLVPPALNALTTVLIYLIARDLFDRQIALLAALMALASPFALMQAATLMGHVASAFWGALALWGLLRADAAFQAGRMPAARLWSAVVGAALGLMLITRPFTAIPFAIPCALGMLIALARRRADPRAAAGAFWPVLLAGALASSLWPLWLYLISGSPTTNTYLLYWPSNKVGFGPDIGPVGHTLAQGLHDTLDGLRYWIDDLYGWPSLSWLPVALGLVFGPKVVRPGGRLWLYVFIAIFGLLVVFYSAYWTAQFQIGPRYYYEAHAGLAVLSGAGLRESVRRLRGRAAAWLEYAVPAALIALSLAFYLPARFDKIRRLPEWFTRAELDRVVALAGGRPALVIVASQKWRDFGPVWSLNSPWYDGPIVVAHSIGDRNIETLRRYPGRRVIFLAGGELTVLGATP